MSKFSQKRGRNVGELSSKYAYVTPDKFRALFRRYYDEFIEGLNL